MLLSSSADESSKCPEYKVSTVRVESDAVRACSSHTCDVDHVTTDLSLPPGPLPMLIRRRRSQRVCQLGLAKVNDGADDGRAGRARRRSFPGRFVLYGHDHGGNEIGSPLFRVLRLVGGMTFSLGLILVVVGGAELFTGNNLIAMAWAARCVQTRQVVRNWVWVYLGNLVGRRWNGGGGAPRRCTRWGTERSARLWCASHAAGRARSAGGVCPGILCNALVCASPCGCAWVRGRWRIKCSPSCFLSAFVACGFEHSWRTCFLPLGFALAAGSRRLLDPDA